MCLPTNLRNCYAVKVRPAAVEQLQHTATHCNTFSEAMHVRDMSLEARLESKSYKWSERILLPLRSQPTSLDWCVEVWCSVLQHVAACCGVLQSVALCFSV